MSKEKNENNILDFKSTMQELIKEDKPEISQEEEIKAYTGEEDILQKRKLKGSSSADEEETVEDEEHLKRLKNIKVKKDISGGKSSKVKNIQDKENTKIEVQDNDAKEEINKSDMTKEDIINQMREKVLDSKLQGNQERSREE